MPLSAFASSCCNTNKRRSEISERRFLCVMGVLGDPLLHFDIQPEVVDAEGDDRQQKPLNIIAKQLTAGAVEHKLPVN